MRKFYILYLFLVLFTTLFADPGTWVINQKQEISEQTILHGDKRTYRVYNEGENSILIWIKKNEEDRGYQKLEILSKNYMDICCAEAIVKKNYGDSQGTYYRASKDTEAVSWYVPKKYVKKKKNMAIYCGDERKFFRIWCKEGKIKVIAEGRTIATLKSGQSVDVMGTEIEILAEEKSEGRFRQRS